MVLTNVGQGEKKQYLTKMLVLAWFFVNYALLVGFCIVKMCHLPEKPPPPHPLNHHQPSCLEELACHGKILAALLCIIIYEKNFSRKRQNKGHFKVCTIQFPNKERWKTWQISNSAFRRKHKGQNLFAYLKNKGTYLDRTKALY